MTDHEVLFQPLQLGELNLPNRIVMTTLKLGYGNMAGEVTERHLAFYHRRAEAGIGLMTTEPMYIQLNGRELPTQLGIHNNHNLDGLKALTKVVHDAGGRIMAHINHAGSVANPMLVPPEELISASDVSCPATGKAPHSMSLVEIEEAVQAFRDAAHRVRLAGFDAVEIPFSHGYLIHQFISPHTNRRDDEYGGSFENRFRFGSQVVKVVREQVGEELPIVVRMNAMDYVEGGLGIEDALQIAQALQELGADALSVTSGTMCETAAFCLYPTGTPKANLLPMAARIREAVSLPVIVAGRIRTPQIASEALQAGQADLIGLGRPFLADPDWVKKTQIGDDESILLCAACHQGCLAELRVGHGTGCVFNPLTGRESEVQINPLEKARQIMVVGGGPAGLQAAITAAQRGHKVTLFEQEKRLGGQFVLAAKAPHKEEFNDLINYLELTAQRAGVDIRLESPITTGMILEAKYDAYVLATGGIPLVIPFPGLEDTNWLLASDLLDGIVSVGTPTALVIGGGLVGLESADYLAAQGIQVTLVEMLDEVGGDMDIMAKQMLFKRLQKAGVAIMPKTKVSRFTPDTMYAQQGEDEISLPIGTVVVAVGVRSNRELPDALENCDLDIHVIGDAVKPRKALEAIWEGFSVGNTL